MKKFFVATGLVLFCGLANADCWLTEIGESRYRSLSVQGCPEDVFASCVHAVNLRGVEQIERLIASGCSGTICSLASRSFVYAIMSSRAEIGHPESSIEGAYLGDHRGAALLICR